MPEEIDLEKEPQRGIMTPEQAIAMQAEREAERGGSDEVVKALNLMAKAEGGGGGTMTSEHDIPGVFEARIMGKARASYQFPCGYVDPEDNVYQFLTMREMTGKEEDYIASDEVSVQERSSMVLSDCIERLMTDMDGGKVIEDRDLIRQIVSGCSDAEGKQPFIQGHPLTSNDRTAGLLFLRRTTLGDVFKPEIRCPIGGCGMLNRNQRIDLDKIEIDRVPRDQASRRRCRIKLSRSSENTGKDIRAELGVLTGHDENQVAMMRPTKKNFRSLQILARLKAIIVDGEAMPLPRDPDKALVFVQSIPKADRDYIRMVYTKIEGSVDTDIEVVCEHCNREFVFPLDLGQIFFWTRADQRSIKEDDIEWM